MTHKEFFEWVKEYVNWLEEYDNSHPNFIAYMRSTIAKVDKDETEELKNHPKLPFSEEDMRDLFPANVEGSSLFYVLSKGESVSKQLDNRFAKHGWRDTTEAYYGLSFTPFMNVIEDFIEDFKTI